VGERGERERERESEPENERGKAREREATEHKQWLREEGGLMQSARGWGHIE
jgi:hypothetical protein